MKELLADIKARLLNGEYKNEENVRLSLVARVLQGLGWNIWNPIEVNTEFVVVPNEDSKKVDVALFLRPFVPTVFVEIKAVGQMQGKLPATELQMRNYNRDNQAMFTVITDGRNWRFYLSSAGGEFSRRCFKTFDLLDDDPEEVEASLTAFLKKSEIENARQKAEDYLKLNQIQRTAEDSLSEARRRISEPPYPSLPDALVSLVAEKGFLITQDKAVSFIKEAAERKPTTPVFQPPVQPPSSERRSENAGRKRRELNPDNPDSLSHTKIIQGKFDGEPVSKWTELVDCAMRKALENGVPFSSLSGVANVSERNPGDPSFHKIQGTPLWIQGMDANLAWKRSLKLARQIHKDIQVVVLWRDKEGASHPGEEAEILWSPSR